jgi:chromosome partitioning protein
MTKIIGVISRKGGTGKTTTTQALGNGLTQRGYKVLFVDLDSQGNLTYALGGTPQTTTIFGVLTGETDIKKAIQHTPQGDLITYSENLGVMDKVLTNTGNEFKLKENLDLIKSQYDYILIDTSAQIGILLANTLTACNSVIITVQAEIFSIKGIDQLNGAIEPVKKYFNRELVIEGILATRYSARSILSRDMRENLENSANKLNTKVFKTSIRECIALRESATLQRSIFEYAPKSNGAKDYKAFIDELIGE